MVKVNSGNNSLNNIRRGKMKAIKILVIDDSLIIRELFDNLLPDLCKNCTVEFAHDGQDGILKIMEENKSEGLPFDLVISDTEMPIKSGLEVLDFVKEKYPEMKFVLTSGNMYKQLEEAAKKKGADYILTKPFDTKELREILEEVSKK